MISFLQYIQEQVVIGDINSSAPTEVHLSLDRSTLILGKLKTQFYGSLLPGNGFADFLANLISKIPEDKRQDSWKSYMEIVMEKYQSKIVDEFLKDARFAEVSDNHQVNEYLKKVLYSYPNFKTKVEDALKTNLVYGKPEINGPKDSEKLKAKILNPQFKLSFIIVGGIIMNIDKANKKIEVIDRSSTSQTRMGSYKGSGEGKPTWILPFGDISFENPREITKILQSLVKYDPSFAKYQFVYPGGYDDANETVSDVIAGKGTIGIGKKAEDAFITSNSGTIYAYHGTSAAIAKVIMKEGLIPGMGPDYVDKILGHSEKLIYLTVNPNEARKYAVRAGLSRNAVILKVAIHDFTKVDFDEDTLYEGYISIPLKIRKTWLNRIIKANPNLFGANTEPSDAVFFNFRLIQKNATTKEQQNLINFIAPYAIKKSTSFGYRGRIPPSDISIAETFKSEKYKGSEEYSKQLQNVLQTRKVYK